MTASPYYDLAPTTPAENLEWRANLREAAITDRQLQAVLRQACQEDVLFFLVFACWLIEPRDEIKVKPFCLWPHQIDAVLVLVKSVMEATAEKPIPVYFDKSRAQGATWIFLLVMLWFWLKDPLFAAGVISRNEEAVDKKNYKGSLFPKLDWAISMLPYWLLPKGFNAKRDRSQVDHVWNNCENGAVIAGTACTAEAFSGDRLSVAGFDEAAKVEHKLFTEAITSIQHVTNTTWVISTHVGDDGPFYDAIFKDAWTPVGEIKPFGGSGVYVNSAGNYKVILDWRDNPSQNRLLYRYGRDGFTAARPEEAEEVAAYIAKLKRDGNWDKIQRRGFVKDNWLRSPWYDQQCLFGTSTPRGIAQDIDRDPRGTVGKCFSAELLDKMVAEQCRPAVWQGEVLVRDGELKLLEKEGGPLRLWFTPGLDDLPPAGRYVAAADIATGVGTEYSSNSCLSVANADSGEQVLEYVDPGIVPPKFARLCVALCEWLYQAYLIWEAAGPTGAGFKREVMVEQCYANIYFREKDNQFTKQKTRETGWLNNRIEHKRDGFHYLAIAMDEGQFLPRSKEMIAECGGWENVDAQKMKYTGSGHGDRAIAATMLWVAMEDLRRISLDNGENTDKKTYSTDTMAGRIELRRRTQERSSVDRMFGYKDFAGAAKNDFRR